MQSFVKIESLQNGEITILTTDTGKSYLMSQIFPVASMSLNAIRVNKILAKFLDLQY